MPSGLVEINKDKEVKFKGYVTAPASGVYPGVLLLHQEFGIDANIRSMAELCAAKDTRYLYQIYFGRTTWMWAKQRQKGWFGASI